MSFQYSRASMDDIDAILEIDMWAFPTTVSVDDLRKLPFPLAPERTEVVRADGHSGLAGLHASYAFADLPVPGGRLDAAGLTWVGVHPQFRRRGVLREMIAHHFAHCRERGEAISILYAAESAIYGRFGYGLATRQLTLTVPRRAELRPVAGADDIEIAIDAFDFETHAPLIRELHGRSDRPGWATFSSLSHLENYLVDLPAFRRGTESVRIVVARRDGHATGYARFARTEPWSSPGQQFGTVKVRELIATDAPTRAALLRTLTNLDLMGSTVLRNVATDDAVQDMLVDLRACEPQLGDGLWLRIVDLPAALTARGYLTDLDLVLEVSDAQIPENAGRWHLRAGTDGVRGVERTDAAPHLSLDVRDLGAAYLGGTSLITLAQAGLVAVHDPDKLTAASHAFSWHQSPHCSLNF